MNKQQIKTVLTETIESDPNRTIIRSILLFGSFLPGDQHEKSDIDLIIELTKPVGLFTFVGMKQLFEEKLGRSVDLVTQKSLSYFIRDKVLNEAEKIYG